MKMPFLTIFLLFIFVLTFRLHFSKKKEGDSIKEFWDREMEANSTRMKDISNLDYINIPYDELPLHTEIDDIILSENIRIINDLRNEKILNLTGLSNTDLKLLYGAPNITRLSQYDLNYTNLVRAISKVGEYYYKNNMEKDAITILEYGILINTDVSLNYNILAQIYSEQKRFDKIENLRQKALNLNSLSKDNILKLLDSSLPV